MSRIHELGLNMCNLPDLLNQYEEAFKTIEQNLTMKGKSLAHVATEQSAWPIYYETRRVELKSLVKHMDAQVQRVRGERSRWFIDNLSRAVGERMIGSYVDADPAYLRMHELHIEVEEVYEKFAAACDAFTKRGFAIRDTTAARIAQIEGVII